MRVNVSPCIRQLQQTKHLPEILVKKCQNMPVINPFTRWQHGHDIDMEFHVYVSSIISISDTSVTNMTFNQSINQLINQS